MKQRRYTEDQIVEILGEVESGKPVTEVARVHGISETTIHRWRKKYGGMGRSELKRLKELESENSRLRRIVAQQAEGSSANGLRVVYGGPRSALPQPECKRTRRVVAGPSRA